MFPVRCWGGTATRLIIRHGSQSVIAQIEAGQLEVTGRGRWPLITFRWRPHTGLAFSGPADETGPETYKAGRTEIAQDFGPWPVAARPISWSMTLDRWT